MTRGRNIRIEVDGGIAPRNRRRCGACRRRRAGRRLVDLQGRSPGLRTQHRRPAQRRHQPRRLESTPTSRNRRRPSQNCAPAPSCAPRMPRRPVAHARIAVDPVEQRVLRIALCAESCNAVSAALCSVSATWIFAIEISLCAIALVELPRRVHGEQPADLDVLGDLAQHHLHAFVLGELHAEALALFM